MLEGKIIRYYRIKANLTQSELGVEICSKSHVSKIETGQTDYANEITMLLAKRLGIDLEMEIERYKKTGDLLHRWHNEMISMRHQVVRQMKEQIDLEPLIEMPDFYYHYLLLKARYLLQEQNLPKAKNVLKKISENISSLSNYEKNLFRHISGIISLSEADYTKAVSILRKINIRYYHNPEHYYNLAVSYRQLNEHSKAYYYAQKALDYFTETNRFLRIIDSETLLLSLEGTISESNFKDTEEKYYTLLQNCELCNDHHGKLIVEYNLAYEYFKRKRYQEASRLFCKLMDVGDISNQLLSRHYFILCCYYLKKKTKEKLLSLAKIGYSLAKKAEMVVNIHLFKLLMYLILNQNDQYFSYLKETALPAFKEHGYINEFIRDLEKDLLLYHLSRENHKDALEVALHILDINQDQPLQIKRD